MKLKGNFNQLFIKLFPYFLIIVASFISTYTFFFGGLPAQADDISFHLSQVTDLVYGFEHGYFGLSTNHLFMGGFALYNYGFYGPLPHYSAAIVTFLTKWAGGDVIFGIKSIVFLSSILGGVYFYKLARKISDSVLISLITSIIFIFLPYRIFCALCRFAFSETVAICFIPMVFYGAYGIIHDEKYSVHTYIALAIGSVGVILSHAFTGLLAGTFGVLYLIFNVKKLIAKRKNFHIWPSLIVTGIFVLFGVGFYVFNALDTKSLGIYRLCDPIIDWTNYEHVADSTANSLQFSGFLNFIWISGIQGDPTVWNGETVSFIVLSIVVYFISAVCMVIADKLISLAPKNKYYKHPVICLAAFLFPVIFLTRVEIYISIAVLCVVYIFISYCLEKHTENSNQPSKKLISNPDFYFLLFSMLLCFALIFSPYIWKVVPQIYYQCQFAWRIWGIEFFFIAMFIALILSYFKKYKSLLFSAAFASTLLLTLSQGLIEKRAYYESGQEIITNGEKVATEIRGSGAQNEMVPQIFYDSSYKTLYSNSLYYKVKSAIYTWQDFIYSAEDYYTPEFLEGEGEVILNVYNTPRVEFSVTVNSEKALLQLPQFYNHGYVCYVDGKRCSDAQNIDGLIAFEIPTGSYTLAVDFECSTPYRVMRPFFYVGLGTIIPIGIFTKYFYHKKELKAEENRKQ